MFSVSITRFLRTASMEDLGGVVKEVVSLLTSSQGLGTILETVMWELQSAFFLPRPWLSRYGVSINILVPSPPWVAARKDITAEFMT